MKPSFVCTALLGCCLAGCVTTPVPDIITYTDPTSHLRTDLIPDNLLEAKGPAQELVALNASRVFKDAKTFEYYLDVRYEAREQAGLLDIVPGQSLIIIADGKEMKFGGSGSINARKERRNTVSETALYRVGAADLKAIAYADKVKVKIVGQNRVLEREFSRQNSDRFVKFVAHYVLEGH